jgi:hypothetical protein
MNAQRDPDRLINAFLMEGQTQLADPVYDAVRATIEQKRQRVVIGPWRLPTMSKIVPIGLGAAAVVVAVVVGTQLLRPASPGGVGAAPSASAAPSRMPSATARPSVAAPSSAMPIGKLDPGTHRIDVPSRTLVPFAFTVPAGWNGRDDGEISKDPDGLLNLYPWIVTHVYPDACKSEGTLTAIGPTVDDLVRALVDQAGSDASTPVDVTLGGYPAKRINMSVPAALDTSTCSNPGLLIQIWADETETGWFAIPVDPAGVVSSVYIADVNGERVVIVTTRQPNTSASDIAELQAIVDSITFEP